MPRRPGSNDVVSIIVPVYNRADFLDKCFDSLLGQSWPQIEILAIDDGSSDNSAKLLQQIAMRDSRVKVILNTHAGAGAARNAGLRAACGKYLMFVDSDDYVDKYFVETMLRTLLDQDADIVQCCYSRVNNGVPEGYQPVQAPVCVDGRELCRMQVSFVGMYTPSIIVWNKIYRRESWDDIWFDEIHTFEDVFTSYKVVYPSRKVVLLPDLLYFWVIHDGSTSLTDYSTEHCADVIKAWEEKNQYFIHNNDDTLVKLNMKRCCYVAAQHIYLLKRTRAERDAVKYHYAVIRAYYPEIIHDRQWSKTTKFRLHLIRIWPTLFGWYSKTHQLDLEK